jgi:hypothetical protein
MYAFLVSSRSLGISGAHFGNHWFRALESFPGKSVLEKKQYLSM